mmetsp:Transcript_15321/g.45763  ORF Transcript_15321/g.45763 Transcript_15321/m.45763 type:complete len:685 (-) Transcript_15321:14-2068(-)
MSAHGVIIPGLVATRSSSDGARVREDYEEIFRRELAENEALRNEDLTTIQRSEFAHDSVDLQFEDLAFSVQAPVADAKAATFAKAPAETKVILTPTSGAFRSSELVAIMGPSGCGKSTLLDMIADVKTAPYEGAVYFNGRPRDASFRLVSSYVPQEDIGFEHCTVREIIQFHQRLKADVPIDLGKQAWELEQLEKENMSILEDLGLAHVADTKFGGPNVRGLSGGQRRRVTLAKGLVSWPHLLFCDEPTSGLSATDAELCVRALRREVHKYNMLCMVVIHQPRPEVARLFDRLLLLTSRPGRMVYDGPMADLVAHCGRVGRPVPAHQNPTDFVLDAITPEARDADPEAFAKYYDEHSRPAVAAAVAAAKDGPERPSPVGLVKAFRARHPYEFAPLRDGQRVATSFGTQFAHLLKRRTTLVARNPELGVGIVVGQLLQGVIASLVVQGALEKRVGSPADFDVYQNQVTVMMNITMNVLYIALANIPTFFDEKLVCVSEQSEGLYSPVAYLLASTVSSLPVAFVAILIGTLVQYLICGPDPVYFTWALFPDVLLNAVLLYVAMDGLFQFCAVTMKSAAEAQNVALFFFGFVSMFNGVAPTPSAFPVWIRWGIWVSPSYYAMSALVIRGFIRDGNEYTEAISNSVGFRDRLTYGSINIPTTYFLFVAFILLTKLATAYAMYQLKQAK